VLTIPLIAAERGWSGSFAMSGFSAIIAAWTLTGVAMAASLNEPAFATLARILRRQHRLPLAGTDKIVLILTRRLSDSRHFQISREMIHGGKRRVVCHGASHCGAEGLFERRGSAAGATGEERGRRVGCWQSRRCSMGRRWKRRLIMFASPKAQLIAPQSGAGAHPHRPTNKG
jgi:hypothetical protein